MHALPPRTIGVISASEPPTANPRPNRRSMNICPTESTDVKARYHSAATMSSGIVWNVRE